MLQEEIINEINHEAGRGLQPRLVCLKTSSFTKRG